MSELEGVLRFWEAKLVDRFLLSPSTITLIELTIKFLKELKQRRENGLVRHNSSVSLQG